MRSISSTLTGKSIALWPVWGSQMLMPLSNMAICSLFPPRMLTSVSAPSGPFCRTSTPVAYFNRSLTLCTGAAAMSLRRSTVTILACWRVSSGALVPVMFTSFISTLRCQVVSGRVVEDTFCATASAERSVATLRTPMMTSFPKTLKREYPRLLNCVNFSTRRLL